MANRDFSIDLRLRTEFAKANADLNRAGAELNQLYESGTRADRALAQTISRYQQSSAAAAKLAADERRLKEAVDQGRISQETFSRSMGTLSAQRLQLAETATLGDRMRGAVATGVGSATAAMIGFATVTLSATAAMSAFNGAVDYADKLNDMTIRLGLSAEKVSAWGYAAKQTGTDLDGLGLGMRKLLDNMGNADANQNGAQANMFRKLGVDIHDLATGEIKDLATIVPEIADKFQGLSSEAEKTQVAMDLFGKSGTDLIEFLSLGSDGLSNMELRARELGMVFSQETLTAADAFNDSLGDLQAVTQGYISQLTAGMLPALQGMVAGMADAAAGGSDLREVGQSLATAISYGIDVLTVFTRLAETLGVVAGAAAVGVQALADAGNAITRLDFSQAGASLGRFRANLGMAGTEINNIWARDTIGETMRFSLAKGPDRSGTPRPASFGSLAEENAWRRTQGLRPLLSSPDYPQAAAASGGSTPTPTRTGGGGRRARSGGGAGAAVSEAQRIAQQAQQRIAQLKEEVALAGQLTEGETKLSEAQRARYDTTEGKWKSLAPKLKEELIAAAEAKDATLKNAAAAKEKAKADDEARRAYDKLVESLRTPAEVALEKAIAEAETFKKAVEAGQKVSEEFLNRLEQKSIDDIAGELPQFQGLAPEVGGAFGEFKKMQEAKEAQEKWYEDMLAGVKMYQDKKGQLTEAAQAQLEAKTALHQQRMAQIEGAKQQAMLSMASDFFGQIATLQNSKNKTMQRVGKAAAIAQTVVNTYQSATGAYAALSWIPMVGPALGIAAAAAAVAAGLANVQAIRSQPEGYATGGYTGDGGKYEPAGVVHRGEFVVRKEVTRSPRVRAMLENLNQNGSAALYGWTQYADGGLVSLPSQPMGNLDRVSPSLNIPAPKINQQTVVVFDEDAVSRTVAANQHMETRILRVIAENPRALGGG